MALVCNKHKNENMSEEQAHEDDCDYCRAKRTETNLRHARAALWHISRTCIEDPDTASFACAASHIPPFAFAPPRDYDDIDSVDNKFGEKQNEKPPKKLNKKHTTYEVLCGNGEIIHSTDELSEALFVARVIVDRYISEHLADRSPIELTEEDILSFGVEVYELYGEKSRLPLPYQIWVDDYNMEYKEVCHENDNREYELFKKLRKKWESRFQSE